jgi:hypothetical protein
MCNHTRLWDNCFFVYWEIRALEEKAYNHITASYYLIAERHLRHEREARHLALQAVPNQPDPYDIHDR